MKTAVRNEIFIKLCCYVVNDQNELNFHYKNVFFTNDYLNKRESLEKNNDIK